MKKILTVFLWLFVLESVMVVHEYGHLREFQKHGVPVGEFSIGVGPVLYEYSGASFPVRLRVAPIMAYVKTTGPGEAVFLKKTAWEQIVICFAGIRNNFLAALIPLLVLQAIAWRRGGVRFQPPGLEPEGRTSR